MAICDSRPPSGQIPFLSRTSKKPWRGVSERDSRLQSRQTDAARFAQCLSGARTCGFGGHDQS
eukprot:7792154-Alexandrium_andersonii.AAC.1